MADGRWADVAQSLFEGDSSAVSASRKSSHREAPSSDVVSRPSFPRGRIVETGRGRNCRGDQARSLLRSDKGEDGRAVARIEDFPSAMADVRWSENDGVSADYHSVFSLVSLRFRVRVTAVCFASLSASSARDVPTKAYRQSIPEAKDAYLPRTFGRLPRREHR